MRWGEKMCNENRMVGVKYVMEALGLSRAAAYRKIRKMNAELEAKGLETIPGKVSAAYLNQKYFNLPDDRGD